MIQAILWIVMVFAVAFLMRPVLLKSKMKYLDGGFGLSFGLGSGLTFLFTWFLCSCVSFKFDTPIMVVCLVLLGVTVHALLFYFDKESFKALFEKKELVRFLIGFAAFTVLFLVAVWAKGHRADINGQTEQFMDFGIMQSIYRQKTTWPEDLWMSGQKINYYYLGLSASTFLTRLAFTTPAYGYNLMFCTLFAGVTLMIFELVSGLILYRKGGLFGAIAGGVTGGLGAVFAGNGHYLFYGIIASFTKKVLHIEIDVKDYWFPDSTVFIGTYPDVGDYGKHEYPAYTMVLGDLHAHLVNMLWTIPLLAILFDYAFRDKKEEKGKARFFNIHILLIGLLLGLYRGSNFWDFPIYYVIAGAVILFTDYKERGVSLLNTAFVLIKGAVIYLIAFFATLPFELGFNKMVNGIFLCKNHSQFYKMVIIWGIPFVLCLILIFVIFENRGYKIGRLTKADIIEITLALCAMGLVIVPEIIYVKDIYGEEYARFNTMFKLTDQAFILFGMISGFLLGWFINKKKIVGGIILSLVMLILSTYIVYSAKIWLVDHSDSYDTMSVLEASLSENGEGERVIKDITTLIINDERPDVHIIEGVGGDYTLSNRISSYTGVCTVMGWPVHEWLWQNDYAPVGKRTEEVKSFYENGNVSYNQGIIDKYDIDYIIVGPNEYELYNVNTEGIKSLGRVIFETESGYMLINTK